MKLNDLYTNQYLQSIEEAFNSSIDIDWHQSNWGEAGGFVIDGIPFVIELQKIAPSTVGMPASSNVIEVTFYRHDKDVESGYSTTGESNTLAQTIYGVVYNAIKDKIALYDGFYFSAEKRHSGSEYEKKVGIYTLLARRVAKETGLKFYISETNTSVKFLLTKESTTNAQYIEYRKKVVEQFDWIRISQKQIKR